MKSFLREKKVKCVMTITDDNCPMILLYNGKSYQIRYTYKKNLYMTGYDPDKNIDEKECIDIIDKT